MRVVERMKERVRKGLRSFLQIQPATATTIMINEKLDYTANAIKNRIWYGGDASELNDLYHQIGSSDTRCFWAAVPTVGREVRKIHTGLPGIMVDALVNIIKTEFNAIEVEPKRRDVWEEIAEENGFKALLGKAVQDCLIVGDGAFKISFDSRISKYPIIEWVPGENVEYIYERGRFRGVTFKTRYQRKYKVYELNETYRYGSVEYALYDGDHEVPMSMVEDLEGLDNVTYAGNFCMAVPLRIFDSDRYKNRGRSIFDRKVDDFDALDESWSQWVQALRDGRSTKYIPEDLIPKNPEDGTMMKPNPFDNQFVMIETPMSESELPKIDLQQPEIPHDSYLATYVTALDLCLQGIISPSTIGIDVKKLDNADAQREKEKTTLYTRGKIIDALQDRIPVLVDTVFKALDTMNRTPLEDVSAQIDFGDYANPSFESKVETIGKGKQYGIMSNEAVVNELYGDTKEEEWKLQEIKRLNRADGMETMDMPQVASETLNGAQITSLMNVIQMEKNNQISRQEAISIITSTLGINEETAERFIENQEATVE